MESFTKLIEKLDLLNLESLPIENVVARLLKIKGGIRKRRMSQSICSGAPGARAAGDGATSD